MIGLLKHPKGKLELENNENEYPKSYILFNWCEFSPSCRWAVTNLANL